MFVAEESACVIEIKPVEGQLTLIELSCSYSLIDPLQMDCCISRKYNVIHVIDLVDPYR